MWLKDLIDAIATACGDAPLGTYWATRVLCADSRESLHDPGGLSSLDQKLRSALLRIIPLDLKTEIDALERKYKQEFDSVRGREILWFIDKEFKMDHTRYQIYSKQSLFQLEIRF